MPQLIWRHSLSPGALLRADVADGVPFHGRTDDLSGLHAWCFSDEPIAVRLYTGHGGMGKTRFAMEACRQREHQGWRAGFLAGGTQAMTPESLRTLFSVKTPILIAVDYADGQVDALRMVLRLAVAEQPAAAVRILLLARNQGQWWDDLIATGAGVDALLQGESTSRILLRPVASTLAERTQAFEVAGEAFARRLDRPFANLPPADLSDVRYDRILLIHMAALAQVEGVSVNGDRGVLSFMLTRERRYWELLLRDRGLPRTLLPAMTQAVALLFATEGAGSEYDAVMLLHCLPRFAAEPPSLLYAIADALHDAYGGDRWIDRLQPDLLGEHLLAGEEKRQPNSVLGPAVVFAGRDKAT